MKFAAGVWFVGFGLRVGVFWNVCAGVDGLGEYWCGWVFGWDGVDGWMELEKLLSGWGERTFVLGGLRGLMEMESRGGYVWTKFWDKKNWDEHAELET